jgi:hypothetical protein
MHGLWYYPVVLLDSIIAGLVGPNSHQLDWIDVISAIVWMGLTFMGPVLFEPAETAQGHLNALELCLRISRLFMA